MESTELRIFREVAHTKSISKAAENMGYVQPNIPAHIKKLEAELKVSLFIRHNKGVALTRDGEKLLGQADKIIALLDRTSRLFKDAARSLHIGATQTIAGYLLPLFLVEYQKKFPDISISVTALRQNTLEAQLINGQADCIITNNAQDIPQGKEIFRQKEALMLITPGSCQSVEDIGSFPVVLNNIQSCPYRETLLNWRHSHETDVPHIIELDTVEAILNTVTMGGGITLLPKTTLQNRTNVNSFYIEELQTTSIHLWVLKCKLQSKDWMLDAPLRHMISIISAAGQ